MSDLIKSLEATAEALPAPTIMQPQVGEQFRQRRGRKSAMMAKEKIRYDHDEDD